MTTTGNTLSGLTGRYLSLTSFRRDGTPVASPVWFVRDGARLLVITPAESFKAKRIRRNPDVRVARCNAWGRLKGEPVPATAHVLPSADALELARRLTRHKYPFDTFVNRVAGSLRRRVPSESVVLELTAPTP